MSVPPPVLIDTDVFSRVFVVRLLKRKADDAAVTEWREMLLGRRVAISFQTRAEAIQGALLQHWGGPRMEALYRILDKTPTVYVDNDVVEEHAQLFADCRQNGHPLHGKIHTADRWVASCAIAKDFPLLSGDAIFEGVPKIELLD